MVNVLRLIINHSIAYLILFEIFLQTSENTDVFATPSLATKQHAHVINGIKSIMFE